jgi:hypothetical protein
MHYGEEMCEEMCEEMRYCHSFYLLLSAHIITLIVAFIPSVHQVLGLSMLQPKVPRISIAVPSSTTLRFGEAQFGLDEVPSMTVLPTVV